MERQAEKITIDTEDIAREIEKRGITRESLKNEDYTGWTDTLMDVLEEKYDVETHVRKDIESHLPDSENWEKRWLRRSGLI